MDFSLKTLIDSTKIILSTRQKDHLVTQSHSTNTHQPMFLIPPQQSATSTITSMAPKSGTFPNPTLKTGVPPKSETKISKVAKTGNHSKWETTTSSGPKSRAKIMGPKTGVVVKQTTLPQCLTSRPLASRREPSLSSQQYTRLSRPNGVKRSTRACLRCMGPQKMQPNNLWKTRRKWGGKRRLKQITGRRF